MISLRFAADGSTAAMTGVFGGAMRSARLVRRPSLFDRGDR
jgi:hypothetical protein